MRRTARAAVCCSVLAMLLAGLSGCRIPGTAGSVTVLGPWTGREQTEFTRALDEFTAQTGIRVDFQGTRALGQVLSSGLRDGTPPDVAVLPSIGDLPRYGDRLEPLDDVLDRGWTAEHSRQWQDLARVGGGPIRAVPVHVSLKSMVWFPPGVPPPRDAADLDELSRSLRESGTAPWCVGMSASATSGWPGTDWIEDLLLRQSGPEVYRQWIAGELPWTSPQVRRAWQTWQEFADSGQVRGGRIAALLTEFQDASRPMSADPPQCLLEHQGSFMGGVYAARGVPAADFARFPGFTPEHPGSAGTWEVSADVAGMFRDTPQARELIRFLVSRRAQEIWAAGDSFSANSAVPASAYRTPSGRRIAAVLTDGGDRLCLDGSDLMPSPMRDAFQRAVLEHLSDPSKLDSLLGSLDRIRSGLPRHQWTDRACGG
ncbi:ABC transporter substrate-binding protein [Saccharopolyspora sp. NFXS83]|uniref:ABC transporter substrate-binding protein n=1 Tax=Saccharopolyspora sp. NFXS83 TaxID=2993560 RepID=UPI00224B9290|nr:ABC transporter substrate-binding protein [Saccharopolyspora sp. NFXS83]MCX2729326.1 ABC transporter substrate-binding protein [Saccharopolyspora sp. NFXS83]